MDDILIIGGGIGGLTLALMLEKVGRRVRVFEMSSEIKPIGVGISLLPHSTRELGWIGLLDELTKVAITTKDSCFFTRFGEFVYREQTGRYGGYEWPQYQIHRGDLQQVLYQAAKERIGEDRIITGWRCIGAEADGDGALAHFVDTKTGKPLSSQRGAAVIACDGIHSAIRKQLYPNEGPPIYSGVNMWRGVTKHARFLTGASYVRAGWLTHGKMVMYPVRDNIDGKGNQLINWVAEVETPNYEARDWNRAGRLEDVIGTFESWTFDWLNVPELIRKSEMILEYPMVDQDPLPRWSFETITLLGDAAHPMYPRGSNGAGQAILDARALGDAFKESTDATQALKIYEDRRLATTAKIVHMNRTNPPDVILREVYLRSGDKPFGKLSDLISDAEMAALTDGYKKVAGYDKEALRR
jgi:2-polyprenyl-6-methoxyphenol hydroxylase-like FAD-dependent oxidoreductase